MCEPKTDADVAHEASLDQQRAGVRDLAALVATFYRTLVEGGISEPFAAVLTQQWYATLAANARP